MRLEAHGLTYHIKECGAGVPLLLLHGFTGSSDTWLPFCEDLGRQARLICPDLPGHGKTEIPQKPERYKMEEVSADLKEILDKLGIEKADVLGYSMGGRLALGFALEYPGKVNKLILESSSPGLATEEERESRRMKDTQLAHFIKEQGIPAFVDYWENIPLFSSLQAMPEQAVSSVRKQRLENSADGLANSLIGMGTGAQPSYWERLHELDFEVLILAGELDDKFCGIAEKMAGKIKSCIVKTISGAGHAIHVENPGKFGTIVSGFLTHT